MLLPELREEVTALGVDTPNAPNRDQLINAITQYAAEKKVAIVTTGILEVLDEDEGGLIVYERDSYRVKALSAYVPQAFIKHYGLQRGHIVKAQLHPHREGESCPIVVRVESVMDKDPETLSQIVPFTERVPYYPTSRILMEADPEAKWDNLQCVLSIASRLLVLVSEDLSLHRRVRVRPCSCKAWQILFRKIIRTPT